MKKSLILSLSAVIFCSFAVYAAETGPAETVKTKTQQTSAAVQKKANTANNIATASGNKKIKAKTVKVSKKIKVKTAAAETKINEGIKKAGAVKNSGVAVSTSAIAVQTIAAPAKNTAK
ncbi:MAG: hypothetical protein WC234_05460 [Endomicrobiaceae bacterium]